MNVPEDLKNLTYVYAKLKSCLKTRLLTKLVYSLGELLDARVYVAAKVYV